MPSRVPGMKAGRSHRRPVCSVDPAHVVIRDEDGRWVCRTCAVEFIQTFMDDAVEHAHKSEGGVELPIGVKDERIEPVNVTPFTPNRRQRRAR